MTVYEVRVMLSGVEPPVWRRLRIPDDASLHLVHLLLQAAMMWGNRHEHEFIAADRQCYGLVDDDADVPDAEVLDERQHTLAALFREPGDRCFYRYDFGDDWLHELELESVGTISPEERPISCLDGAGACPPEDCGGVPGYAGLLESLRNRGDDRHADAVDLLGESFDPDAFDCRVFNALAGRMFLTESEEGAPEDVSEEMGILMSLRDFLESEGMPESAMSVMALDGFFAALVIHPVTFMPGTWLPMVWDISGEGREPEFSSQEAIQKGMGPLFTYYNSLVRQLTDDPDGFVPLYDELEIESDEDRLSAAEDWAVGFMAGAMLDELVWKRTVEDREGNLLLAPFAMLAGIFDDVKGPGAEQLSEMKADAVERLGSCVLDLQEFWLPWRQDMPQMPAGGGTIRADVRIGRNEPCPCGSGKKYKQCCGR
jgi:uncharacterized protein